MNKRSIHTALKADEHTVEAATGTIPARFPRPLLYRLDALHQTVGNQAVGRLILQSKVKSQESGVGKQQSGVRGGNGAIQMKSICPSGGSSTCEEEKKEAVQTKPIAEQITPLVQRQEEEQEKEPEEEPLQMQRQSAGAAWPQPGLSSRLQGLQGGEPLPASTRAFFEPRFGADFGHVRVHSNSAAAETAQQINAQAFTQRCDIVFGPGRYQPQTPEGQRLLAHELTHVVQQRARGENIQRYQETTKPASRAGEAAKDILLGPGVQIYRMIKAKKCLEGLFGPMKKITFDRWITSACARSTTGFLHSREWDAFGHCWIACEGTRRCGASPTAVLGALYELQREYERVFGKNPHDSFFQDNNNHARGGSLSFTAGTCFALCDAAHRGNKLDLSAPQRTCANCSTYPRSGSEGPCPSPPAPSPAAEKEAREKEQRTLEERLRQEYQSCLSRELERPGGLPSPEEEAAAREKCRQKTGYPQ